LDPALRLRFLPTRLDLPIEVDATRQWFVQEWQIRRGAGSTLQPTNDAGRRLSKRDVLCLRKAIRRPATPMFIEKEGTLQIQTGKQKSQ
jgi:hypothetical protein